VLESVRLSRRAHRSSGELACDKRSRLAATNTEATVVRPVGDPDDAADLWHFRGSSCLRRPRHACRPSLPLYACTSAAVQSQWVWLSVHRSICAYLIRRQQSGDPPTVFFCSQDRTATTGGATGLERCCLPKRNTQRLTMTERHRTSLPAVVADDDSECNGPIADTLDPPLKEAPRNRTRPVLSSWTQIPMMCSLSRAPDSSWVS
jgi:hypothetical protein